MSPCPVSFGWQFPGRHGEIRSPCRKWLPEAAERGKICLFKRRGIEKTLQFRHIIFNMVEKEKKTRSAAGLSGRRGRKLLILALLVVPLLLICGVAFGVRTLYRLWFLDNERLELRRIQVASSGYWRGREEALSRRLHLAVGTGLFTIDPRIQRENLEKIPCVESARVYRIPPDTLRFELLERIPRAALGSPSSPWVADENSVVMPRRESVAESDKLWLPVITGIPLGGIRPGEAERRLQPAMDLIMLTLRRYPMFRIRSISLASPETMVCYFSYRGGRMYRAVLPVKSRGLAFLLSALESAIIEVRRSGDDRHNFNLTYDGRVVID